MSFTNRRAKRLRQRRAEHHAPPVPEYPLPDGEVSAEDGGSRDDVPRHSRRGRRTHKRGRAVAVVTVGVLAFAGSAAGIAFTDIQQNIDRHDIGDMLGRNRPDVVDASPADPASGEALNVLVIGSDQRDADDPDSESVDGMRSDTTMIAHVSADRDRVDVVSIPRDTLVDIPSCILPNGRTTAPESGTIFNSAFTLGGQTGDVGAAAACTINTVEELTDVFIDDFVVVDFNGFTTMIEALDGVPMAIEQPIDDPQAHLQLAAGCQLLDAEEALGYARVRK
ncbi:LCP family protein, partial [Georgenia sp. 10Sc9-8]|nr:LCP family protein [Georgenia halotolerans]